jgi:peptidoglycan-N-acetylglucosamine deacetylase
MRRHGCLFMLTNHPFLSGRPGRVETLRKLVEHALDRGDVEFVTAAEVAARVREDPNAATRKLRPVVVDATTYPDW